ncbi:MAG: hypothetical protein D6797_00200 [Bdellovibrio sp.]|nr:MAG: hypothetical protein D6797_00200 [Bdellovibrio sp.]
MLQCPQCQSELHEDFGLVVCQSCGASLFVNMDGEVDYATGEESGTEESVVGSDENGENEVIKGSSEEELETGWNQANEDISMEAEEHLDVEEYEEGLQGNSNFEEENSEISMNEEFASFGEADNENSKLDPEFLTQDDGSQSGVASVEDLVQSVADFANTEVSMGQEGNLFYNLEIKGIDSPELKEEVFDVLNDSKFLWSAKEIMSNIQSGTLLIKDLSAVKAFILIQEFKRLNLEIRWDQHVLQTE